MSYDCTKWGCCQETYIVGELVVRTDWQVIGGARVMPAALQAWVVDMNFPFGLRM
jgi:hypothetical protein